MLDRIKTSYIGRNAAKIATGVAIGVIGVAVYNRYKTAGSAEALLAESAASVADAASSIASSGAEATTQAFNRLRG